jgi:hypothetical protein
MPANTSYAGCYPDPCYLSGNIVTWESNGLSAGGRRYFYMYVNVHRNLDSDTRLVNRARVRVYDTPEYADSVEIRTRVVSAPSLWLTIDNGKTSVEAGEELEYILRYGNSGNGPAYNTAIIATPPSAQHVKDITCSPISDCQVQGGQVFYDIGRLPGGDSDTVRLLVTVRDPLPAGALGITATAIIDTPTPGDPPEGNTAQDADEISTRPDLVVVADYEDVMPYPGKRVTYTVHYSNEGHIATTGVVITATRAPHTFFRPGASDPEWTAVGGGQFRYEIGDHDYAEGGDSVFVVVLTDEFTPTVTNFDATFVIQDSGVSGEDANPDDNVFLASLGIPNLRIDRVVADADIWVGQPGLLRVTLRNTGAGPACGVYNPAGCSSFSLDLFPDSMTPPDSYPIKDFGECYVFVPSIPAHSVETAVISFTTGSWQNQSGFCGVRTMRELWLKVDNWDPDAPPYPAESGLVPEYNEFDNVRGPVVPGYDIFLPMFFIKS